MNKGPASTSRTGARIAAWIDRLAPYAELCTHGYPPEVRRRLKLVNVTAFLIAVFSLFYAILLAIWDFDTYLTLIVANLLLVVAGLLAPLGHRVSETCSAVVIAIVEYVALVYFVGALGRDSGIQIHFLVGAAIPFAIFGLSHIGLVVTAIVAGIVLHVVTFFLYPPQEARIVADPALLKNLYVSAVVTTGSIIAVIVLYAYVLADRARAEADTLLSNILPDPVAERLKAEPGVRIADSVPDASVLFTDLVGFTPLAQDLDASEMLSILDEIFTEFDRLAAEHGVEKIKTVGDGYMAVSGVVEPADNNTERLARLALQLPGAVDEVAKHHGMDLKVRIGMAAGPVMAGIIGTNKFSYDVWGETVNLASRLESHGLPGEVHISKAVQHALRRSFHCKPRGKVDIKGVGPLETWLLKHEKTP